MKSFVLQNPKYNSFQVIHQVGDKGLSYFLNLHAHYLPLSLICLIITQTWTKLTEKPQKMSMVIQTVLNK